MGPGDVIAETYEVIRRLGAGGMGTVFEAKHLRVGKKVAIKVLTAAPEPELLARFRLEAEIASRLGHPHIVEVLDLDTLPSGIPYMVMELLDGENLRARLRKGTPSLPETLRIVTQIASALRAAHGASVIHRDLKPENVFLAREGITGADHVKLLDFGISKVQGISLTANNVVLGTPAYMAPEQATGATLDARVDQFALAMIAYEMIAGAVPFEGQDSTRIMQIIAYEPLPPLAPRAGDTPAHVVAAIERALSKDPRDRFESMADFVAALEGESVAPASSASLRSSGPPSQSTSSDRDESPRSRTSEAVTAFQRPVVRRRRWWPLWIALMMASVAITSIILVLRRSSNATTPVDAMPIDTEIAPDAPVDMLIDEPPPIDSASIDTAPLDARVPSDARTATATPISPETIPPEVTADLAAAQAALDSSDPGNATRLARRTLETMPTKRAYLILVDAACRQSDLAAARGWMRAMPVSIKKRATEICAANGVQL